MNEVFLYILIFVAFEIFEVFWQKAPSLYEVLVKIYRYYQKSIFLVLFLHPTLFFGIYLMIISGYDIYIQILLSIKLSDIALKLLMVKKLFIDNELNEEYKMVLHVKLENFMFYIGVILYPVFIYLGFN